MSGAAISTMIVICTLVWGGFGVLLWRALRQESRKQPVDKSTDQA
jgi:hypothetical protein